MAEGKCYHVDKRADGMWEVKLEKGEKAIKLFKSKPDAEAYTKAMAKKQDAGIKTHTSKGKNKGRIQKN